jgi:hypothetical protein
MKLKNSHVTYTQTVLAAACTDGCEIHRCNAFYYQWFQTWHEVPYDCMAMSKHVGVKWLLYIVRAFSWYLNKNKDSK